MKVAVVGMYDRQVQHIRMHEFPHLDIRVANKGEKYGLKEKDQFKTADRILVMKKFVSHALTDGLDKSKTTLVDGGFGSLRKILERLNDLARAQNVGVGAPRKDLRSTYEQPAPEEEDEVKTDFSKLKDAKPGDVLIFQRPPRMTPDKWKTRIQLARSYYKRNYGVLSEEEHRDGEVRVLVTKLLEKEPEDPPVQDPALVTAEPAPAVRSTAPSLTGEMDRRFWQEVYLQAMRNNPGAYHTAFTDSANTAVDALHKKFS